MATFLQESHPGTHVQTPGDPEMMKKDAFNPLTFRAGTPRFTWDAFPSSKVSDMAPFLFSGQGVTPCPAEGEFSGRTVRVADLVTPPYKEEIFTAFELVTTVVVIVKVALALPPATVTLAGTVAADVLLLASDTTAPPVGAGPLSVTVPLELFPPTMAEGLRERDDSEDGFTVRLEVLVIPVDMAETFTAVELETDTVATGKVALVAPPDNVTIAGTLTTDGLVLDSVTFAPSTGAGPLIVTIPVESLPPITLDGFRERDDSKGIPTGRTVRLADLVTPPYKPEIFTVVEPDTGLVVTPNVALLAPADTVTLAGMFATELSLLDNDTTAPPASAGPFSVTVPVDEVPAVTTEGLTVTEESTG